MDTGLISTSCELYEGLDEGVSCDLHEVQVIFLIPLHLPVLLTCQRTQKNETISMGCTVANMKGFFQKSGLERDGA